MRRRGAESADGTGGEDGTAEQACHLETVHQASDTDVPSQHGVELGSGAEDGCQVVDGVDVVLLHRSGNLHDLCTVDTLDRTTLVGVAFERTEVAANDVAVAIGVAQHAGQFGTNLSAGTNNKNFFHGY